MAEVERVGHVSEITPPPEGTNRPWTAKVGGRKVKFWGTVMGSDEPSAALVTMRDADNRGLPVKAVGLEEIVQGRNGSFPSFTAKTITLTDSVAGPTQNGGSPSTFQDGSKDRSIVSQVAHKIAGSWAASGAIKPEEVSSMAGYLFYSIQELAEGKATGSDQEAAQ